MRIEDWTSASGIEYRVINWEKENYLYDKEKYPKLEDAVNAFVECKAREIKHSLLRSNSRRVRDGELLGRMDKLEKQFFYFAPYEDCTIWYDREKDEYVETASYIGD